jgi:bacterial/archaeal transporter family-2 protein
LQARRAAFPSRPIPGKLRIHAAAGREGGVVELLGIVGFTFLAIAAGVSFVVQQAVNAELRGMLHSAAWAGFVSYLGGTLCMLALALALRDGIPSAIDGAKSSWWGWTGGVFGAIYIGISILLVPRLGAATFIALLVGGQMLASLIFDHYGLFGMARQPADLSRVIGAMLLIGGVVLIRR